MKKNLYYAATYKRINFLKAILFGFFLAFGSLPRLLLEVFLRKNFGERYFSFSTAILFTTVLFLYPIGMFTAHAYIGGDRDFGSFLATYLTWYIFLAAFVMTCLQRRREVKGQPSVFDFAKFSLYSGDVNPRFYARKVFGKEPDRRIISTLIEPALCLVIGIGFMLLFQKVGALIIFCSVFYSLSYYGAYHVGDNFVMDTIDEMICNDEMVGSFVEGKQPSETRGFEFFGRRPTSEEFRRKVVDNFSEDDSEDGVSEAM